MTYEQFKAEVETAIATLNAIASNKLNGFGDAYKQNGVDINIDACQCAADITGYDVTFCKMLNREFRHAAVAYAMEQAA